ncbi:MAG: YifB family Mg chelatase-like AAA ATPase [Thermoleophilia bacterium]|nr:YifB family Mg chelatase-like AAA ATPase [Thermoleophilia bacterium]
MLASLHSHAVIGMEATPIEVETDLGWGLPAFNIVGLPDAAVRESKERVRAGMANSGFDFPLRRITVNLAPADVRKAGPSFDLPIALSLLAASEQLKIDGAVAYSAVGELSLDGTVRKINGALSIAEGARRIGHRGVLLPAANAAEAALVEGVEVIPVENLKQAVEFLEGKLAIPPTRTDSAGLLARSNSFSLDLADVKGQEHARRALEVCAAGGHNLLMIGPPGSGKTMLARRLPSILPPLDIREAIEVTRIYSVAGLLAEGRPLIPGRPFRSPHHSISHVGLAGGGGTPRPGEVSLSHLGVLFLDELPEFSRVALETLRQPMEDGLVAISRALARVTFPASFMLVAAMNPCPCGYLGDSRQQCVCLPHRVSSYRGRVSGPLMDRIDVAVEVPGLSKKDLLSARKRESSAAVAARVAMARERQLKRLAEDSGGGGVFCNAQLNSRQVERICRLDPAADQLLAGAIDRLGLSARAHHRILKVSRTIADLDGAGEIGPAHLAEAISYRSIDRKGWNGL